MSGLKGFSFLDFSAFHSDVARLNAVIIVGIVVIVVGIAGPISKAWIGDRSDRRKYDLLNAKLQAKIEARKSKKK